MATAFPLGTFPSYEYLGESRPRREKKGTGPVRWDQAGKGGCCRYCLVPDACRPCHSTVLKKRCPNEVLDLDVSGPQCLHLQNKSEVGLFDSVITQLGHTTRPRRLKDGDMSVQVWTREHLTKLDRGWDVPLACGL